MHISTRRLVVGALLLGAALQVTEVLMWPPGSDGDTAQMLASAAAHPGRYQGASVCETLSWLLIAPTLVTLVLAVRGRGRILTRTSGAVLLLGSALVGAFVSTTMNTVAATLAQRPDRAQAAATWNALVASPVLVAFVVVLLVSEVAVLPFTIGLVRARLAGPWLPVLAVVAVVGGTRAESAGSWWGGLGYDLPFVLLLLALGRIALRGDATPDPRPVVRQATAQPEPA